MNINKFLAIHNIQIFRNPQTHKFIESTMATTSMYTNMKTDMEHFDYGAPIPNKYKSKTCYVNKSKSNPTRARYQMVAQDESRLRCPYGISKPFEENEQEKDRKSLDMTIDSDVILDILTKLDEQNVQVAHKNALSWFGKQMSIDQIRFMYQPIVRPHKDGKYKPTFRTKVNCNPTAENCTRFFTIREEQGVIKYIARDSSIITNGCQVVPIVEISSLWFSSKTFGMSIDCTDVIVFSGLQRDEFPFQWGDSKPVPMESSDEPSQSERLDSEPICELQSPTAAVDNSSSGRHGSVFVPPAEPYSH